MLSRLARRDSSSMPWVAATPRRAAPGRIWQTSLCRRRRSSSGTRLGFCVRPSTATLPNVCCWTWTTSPTPIRTRIWSPSRRWKGRARDQCRPRLGAGVAHADAARAGGEPGSWRLRDAQLQFRGRMNPFNAARRRTATAEARSGLLPSTSTTHARLPLHRTVSAAYSNSSAPPRPDLARPNVGPPRRPRTRADLQTPTGSRRNVGTPHRPRTRRGHAELRTPTGSSTSKAGDVAACVPRRDRRHAHPRRSLTGFASTASARVTSWLDATYRPDATIVGRKGTAQVTVVSPDSGAGSSARVPRVSRPGHATVDGRQGAPPTNARIARLQQTPSRGAPSQPQTPWGVRGHGGDVRSRWIRYPAHRNILQQRRRLPHHRLLRRRHHLHHHHQPQRPALRQLRLGEEALRRDPRSMVPPPRPPRWLQAQLGRPC
jgi:hypothetical protein